MTLERFHRVSKREHCPICEKSDWCLVSNDGATAICMRVDNGRPANCGGWIHILKAPPRRTFIPRRPTCPLPQLFDAARVMSGYRDEFTAEKVGHDIFDSLLEIADDLHLCAADIDRLKVGRSAFNDAWAFPMRDGSGKIVGIRLRRYNSSDKWSVSGSKDGLFYDPDLQPLESVYKGVRGREIVIVEGATDAIAGYTLGLPAVGRSSCNTGVEHLKELCSRLRVNRVTIVADNDPYKSRPGSASRPPTRWRPGLDGAARLAKDLGRLYRIVRPPEKDLRDWLGRNLTPRQFWYLANLKKWRMTCD